ncbi:MAG: YdcF family protein [Flavobacteriales bacterium]|nr:YdcF family protein [Flavobacteriales bacterium]
MAAPQAKWILLNERPTSAERRKATYMFQQPFYTRKWFKASVALLFISGAAYIFREELLKSAGDFLVREDACTHVDAIVVLGGNSYERGLEGIKLFEAGWANLVVCTGGNIPTVFDAMDTVIYESELTRSMMMKRGVSGDQVIALTTATSTREEASEVLAWCKEHQKTSLMVVSSTFHTRRVSSTFEEAFEGSGVDLFFRAAPSTSYDEKRWWEAESGLIMVFNEYAKTAYYLMK